MAISDSKTYYSDLDVARGVLMALGVVLHTANVFAPGSAAPIQSPSSNIAFLYLSDAIHLFRMPAFFAVSGFFCWMSLKHYSADRFLRLRSKRILIPLVATAVTFNAVEIWLRSNGGDRLLSAYLTGEWVLHLWFLIVVFIYFLLSAGVSFLIAKFSFSAPPVIAKMFNWGLRQPIVIVFLGALIAYLPLAMGKLTSGVVYPEYLFGVSFYTVLEYSPFFIFGALLNYFPAALDEWRRYSHGKALFFLAAIIFIPIAVHKELVSENLAVGIWGAGAWIATLNIFGLFSVLLGRLNVDSKFFAEPAYTIYLAHHLLVFVIGSSVLKLAAPIVVQFVFIVVIILGITLVFHFHVVRRIPFLRLMYNGK
ncbi:MAG: acyltransferase family protein [Marinicaulis sp.]|nr:acyltransferase family protein [Marinicaulis sp.]